MAIKAQHIQVVFYFYVTGKMQILSRLILWYVIVYMEITDLRYRAKNKIYLIEAVCFFESASNER